MANATLTTGTMEIRCNDKEVISSIYKLMDTLRVEKITYATNILDALEEVEINKNVEGYNYSATFTFDGYGRYDYLCNIESMFSWIKDESTAYWNTDESLKEDNVLKLKFLEDKDFSIIFTYVDDSGEVECFIHSIEHKAGEDLYKYKVQGGKQPMSEEFGIHGDWGKCREALYCGDLKGSYKRIFKLERRIEEECTSPNVKRGLLLNLIKLKSQLVKDIATMDLFLLFRGCNLIYSDGEDSIYTKGLNRN